MARQKDVIWNAGELGDMTVTDAQLAVLMDIRDELKKLNSLLGCPNFVDVPRILRGIRTKLPTRRRKQNIKPKEKKRHGESRN